MEQESLEFTDNVDRNRYEVWSGDTLAGFAEYIRMKNVVVFSHTEVQPEFEGQGVGSALARYALNDVRADGTRKVQAVCPFITGWIQRHPDYHDLMR